MADLPSIRMKKLKKMSEAVKVCRDFFMGSKYVLNKDYIPKLFKESDDAYKLRLATTAFVNMYSPIVSGIAGLVTRKEATITGYDGLDFEDVDMKGNSLSAFIKQCTLNSLNEGVQYVAALSDTEANRGYLRAFSADDLYSYQMDGKKVMQMVFKETIEQADGAFGTSTLERFVVFKIGGGELWYKEGDESEVSRKVEWTNSLQYIPVQPIVTGKEVSQFEFLPRMYDIAKLNQVMVNQESNLGNLLGVVGNPIPVFYGDVGEGKLVVGVKDGFSFSNKNEEGFEWVEITGAGISKVESKIADIAKQIDKLSFSMLSKDDSNTVIDAKQSQSKNTSFLSDVAEELESSFTHILRALVDISNKSASADASIVFKKDFEDVLFSDSQLKTLHELVQSGDLSRETFWNKLKVANVLPKDFDAAQENQRIQNEGG